MYGLKPVPFTLVELGTWCAKGKGKCGSFDSWTARSAAHFAQDDRRFLLLSMIANFLIAQNGRTLARISPARRKLVAPVSRPAVAGVSRPPQATLAAENGPSYPRSNRL